MAPRRACGSTDIKRIEERLLQVKAVISSTAAECRLAKQRHRRQGESRPATEYQKDVALHIFALTHFEAAAASEFLHRRAKLSREDAARYVEDTFIATNEIDCQNLGVDSSSQRRQYACAMKFVQEWQLAGWVSDQNHRLGLAPTAESIWHARQSIWQKLHGQIPAEEDFGRSVQQWVQRWRLRWGGRLGKIAVGDRESNVSLACKERRLVYGEIVARTTKKELDNLAHENKPCWILEGAINCFWRSLGAKKKDSG